MSTPLSNFVPICWHLDIHVRVVRMGIRRQFCFPEPALRLFDRLLRFPSHGVAQKRFLVFVTRSGGFPTSSFVK